MGDRQEEACKYGATAATGSRSCVHEAWYDERGGVSNVIMYDGAEGEPELRE